MYEAELAAVKQSLEPLSGMQYVYEEALSVAVESLNEKYGMNNHMTIEDRVAIHAAFAGVDCSRVVFLRVHGSPLDRVPFVYIVECDQPDVYTVYNHEDLSAGLCPVKDLQLVEM